jgi:quinoprotein glucose dehydrogenase
MTFQHSDGRQYVVVSAGGHGGFQTKLSDVIVAFALPKKK